MHWDILEGNFSSVYMFGLSPIGLNQEMGELDDSLWLH